MTVVSQHGIKYKELVRDARPVSVRIAKAMEQPDVVGIVLIATAVSMVLVTPLQSFIDLIFLFGWMYWRWHKRRPFSLPFKLPAYIQNKMKDPHNPPPGKSSAGKAEGVLFLGIDREINRELWVTNTDARTHILYLGTTGAGKTEGLKSLCANALCWGSGFAYTDGKADTDLWASLYALARRFGRDDDLLVLNYMTANTDDGAVSNTMNPFSNGSASYLTNMIVSLMPDAGGDNAMWKERAVALMGALMPALTFKRDKQGLLLDVATVRDHLDLAAIIRLSRDSAMPERIIRGLQGYLQTLPGYVDAAFDDDGSERPPAPDQPMYDLQVARQQHGYLSMQFTRSLQSLSDDYGYIFKAQLADIDVIDVVLNRRILVVLIPALEKSSDEAANLGKIVAACLKGMMGATLGNTVEGSWENAIESKQTRSSSSFMTIFDEVGYYTAQGMAVMAAQARSLGFSLVFAAQDLPAMEKRIKQEARSILGNCNIKIFGKLEDPTDTKNFLKEHAGSLFVYETKGSSAPSDSVAGLFFNNTYYDDRGSSATSRDRVSYDGLRGQREGEANIFLGDYLSTARLLHAVPEKVKALRVQRLLPVPGTSPTTEARAKALKDLTGKWQDPAWTAAAAGNPPVDLLNALADAPQDAGDPLRAGVAALRSLSAGAPSGSPSGSVQAPSTATVAPVHVASAGYQAGITKPVVAVPAHANAEAGAAVMATQSAAALRAGDENAFAQDVVVPPAVASRQTARQAPLDVTAVTPAADETTTVPFDLSLPDELAALAQRAAATLSETLSDSKKG